MSLLPSLETKSLNFPTPGTEHSGKLVAISEPVRAMKFNPDGPSNTPDYWDDEKTQPKMKIILDIEVAERDDANDDGIRKLHVVISKKPGSLYWAVNTALQGHDRLGGILTVKFTGTDPESKNPSNPRKLYAASYQAAALTDSLGGGGGGPWDPTPTPTQQAAPAPAPAPAPQQAATPAPAPAGVPSNVDPTLWAGMSAEQQQAFLAATGQQQ